MTIEPTIVVVDATFLRHLKDPKSVQKLEVQSRVASLRVYPSMPNVLEALKHRNPEIRAELLAAIRRWLGDRPLLPWPQEVLRLSGEALAAGTYEFIIYSKDLDYLVDHFEEIENDSGRAERFLDSRETDFGEAFVECRNEMQALIKKNGLRGRWPTLPVFLEEEWSNPDTLQHFAKLLWSATGVRAAMPPLGAVLRSEPWRVALEGLGAAMYYRAVVLEQPKNPAGFVDLGQLTYVTFHTRARIFVTDDKSLYDCAQGILAARYPNVRVMRGRELLS